METLNVVRNGSISYACTRILVVVVYVVGLVTALYVAVRVLVAVTSQSGRPALAGDTVEVPAASSRESDRRMICIVRKSSTNTVKTKVVEVAAGMVVGPVHKMASIG